MKNSPTTEKFEHDGKVFEITTEARGTKFTVVAKLNGEPVSPEYSVDLVTNYDYFNQHSASLVEHLQELAKSDIRCGMYYPPRGRT